MSTIDVLRDEYPGDDAWHRFVSVFRPAWEKLTDKDHYRSKFIDEEISIVLAVTMGGRADEWFNKPIGALGKRAPLDVMKSEPSGAKIIRSLLMRMPR
jgi:hypothetical protein